MPIPRARHRHLRALPAGVAALLLFLDGVAVAQTPGGGSSLPQISREELMRRFDLNSDGKVDESEAELGRAKMRRERLDQERNRQIDPLTGRPRGEAAEADAQPAEPPRKPITGIDDLLPPRKPLLGDSTDEGLAVGKTAKGKAGEGRSRGRASRSANATEGRGGASGKGAPKGPGPFGAGRQSDGHPAGAAGPISGGVRAGAPPARPGYGAKGAGADAAGGAASRKDRPLNAGLPRESLPPAGPSAGSKAGGGNAAAAAKQAGPPISPQTGRSSARPNTPSTPPRQPLLPDRASN